MNRITGFRLTNVLSHRSLMVSVPDKSRVLLLAGDNGSGKTTILQAIRLCLSGELQRGIGYKKDLDALVTRGEKHGAVEVSVEKGGMPAAYKFSLNTGNHGSSSPNPKDWGMALDPHRFLTMEASARRQTVMQLAGVELKSARLVEDLVKDGHDQGRIDRAMGFVRLGIAKAVEEAKTAATEARGAWKAITGEVYGEKKGADWAAAVPSLPEGNLPDLLGEQGRITMRLQAAKSERDRLNADRISWEAAKDAPKVAAQLSARQTALDELLTDIAANVEEADALAALASAAGSTTAPCPSCGTLLCWDAKNELKEYESAKPSKPAPVAHKELQALRAKITEQRAQENTLRRHIAESETAQVRMRNMPAEPNADEIAKALTAVTRIETELQMADSEIRALRDGQADYERAKSATAKARAEHENVVGYAKLAEAIELLPTRYLSKALSSINTLLAQTIPVFGAPVAIGEDMAPTYNGIPYALASESQQLRVELAIGWVLAKLSGTGVVLVDRIDLLAPARRGPVLKWMAAQEDVQFIVAATLKAPPTLPAAIAVEWLEGGA